MKKRIPVRLKHIKTPPPQQYLTIKEAANRLGVTPLTLRNWDKAEKLKAYRHPINNYRIYRTEEIELFLRKIRFKGKVFLG
jgi:excisionase family DNA binding protein